MSEARDITPPLSKAGSPLPLPRSQIWPYRRAAAGRGRSPADRCWWQRAGSGKDATLMARLVAPVFMPPVRRRPVETVAVTFTRKSGG